MHPSCHNKCKYASSAGPVIAEGLAAPFNPPESKCNLSVAGRPYLFTPSKKEFHNSPNFRGHNRSHHGPSSRINCESCRTLLQELKPVHKKKPRTVFSKQSIFYALLLLLSLNESKGVLTQTSFCESEAVSVYIQLLPP